MNDKPKDDSVHKTESGLCNGGRLGDSRSNGGVASTSMMSSRATGDDALIDYARRQIAQTSRPAADAAELPTIPGYEIERLLGRGGMGSVFLARDLALDIQVAIKVPHSKRAFSRERFLQEASTLAKIKHPNIVPVKKAEAFEDGAYFVMDYVDGDTAQALVRRFSEHAPHELDSDRLVELVGIHESGRARELNGILSGSRPYYRLVAWWMAGVADALQSAHRMDILHRDIKPNNLILSKSGPMLLADFGLACTPAEQSDSGGQGVTGTHPYTAPEKAIGDWAKLDHRSDIWALGATMYELLAYRRAYARTGIDVLQDIVSTDPKAPREIVDAVPRGLEAICLKALRRDPRERFQSASEMADALHRWLGEVGRSRRRFSVAAIIGAVSLVAVVGWQVAKWQEKEVPSSENVAMLEGSPGDVATPSPVADSVVAVESDGLSPVVDDRPTPTVELSIVFRDLRGSFCPTIASQVLKKFYDVRDAMKLDDVTFTREGDSGAAYKVDGSVAAYFPSGIPEDGVYGVCEVDVSFRLLRRAPDGEKWLAVDDEIYQASDTFDIAPTCGAAREKARLLAFQPIKRILTKVNAALETQSKGHLHHE